MRLVKIGLDYVSMDRIFPCTQGPDGSEFETRVIEAVRREGFYNPLSTNIRERTYRYDSNIHYLHLGNHRYWIAQALGLTHVWVIYKFWNCQLEGIAPGAKAFLEVKTSVIPKTEPPWDIRDLEPIEYNSDYPLVRGEARQATQEGNFTGKLLINPDLEVSLGKPLNLNLRNKTTTLLE